MASTPRAAALAYAARGWQVFPCHSVGAHGCSCRAAECGSPGKHPRIAGGLRAASADPEVVDRWWGRWPHANVAVRTGAASGLVVIDIDPPHGGTESWKQLVESQGALPAGPVVRTGAGGTHLYFAHPDEPVRNSAGTRLGPGIDVRGDGGYVIVPPSRHMSGAQYQWQDLPGSAGELPDLPDWLLDRLRRSRQAERAETREPIRLGDSLSAWARAALEDEAAQVRAAPQGSRNHTLNRAAFCLGQIVGAGVLDASLVERVLSESGLAAGLGEREVALTIRSGLRAGIDHPRGPRATSTPVRIEPPRPPLVPEISLDAADML